MAVEPGKELLWKYVRNTCSDADRIFIEQWIQTDPSLKLKIEELKLLDAARENSEPQIVEEVKPQEPISTVGSIKEYIVYFVLMVIGMMLIFFISNWIRN
jgi:anti-sigma factor RsiW